MILKHLHFANIHKIHKHCFLCSFAENFWYLQYCFPFFSGKLRIAFTKKMKDSAQKLLHLAKKN
ncbi:hypothetical protein HanRHA438_Chr11g0488161 [Helianthus annuus]|nr:hypothetical protein HanRHA438_Chr11g0488161 [Helianthus annuus]